MIFPSARFSSFSSLRLISKLGPSSNGSRRFTLTPGSAIAVMNSVKRPPRRIEVGLAVALTSGATSFSGIWMIRGAMPEPLPAEPEPAEPEPAEPEPAEPEPAEPALADPAEPEPAEPEPAEPCPLATSGTTSPTATSTAAMRTRVLIRAPSASSAP